MNFKEHIEQGADSEYLARLFDIERYAWMTLCYDMAMVIGIDGSILTTNSIWERSTGHSQKDLNSKHLLEFMDYEDRELVLARFQRLITSAKGATTFAFRFRCSDDRYKRLNWNIYYSPELEIIYCVVKDISDVKDFSHAAYHDTLTGLSNRLFLLDNLPKLIEDAGRQDQPLALFLIDLDGFKSVNDSMGHQAGDYLLQIASERLRLIVSDQDYCVRLGGDEFILLEKNCGTNGAERLAKMIITSINKPVLIDESDVQVGASIGIAIAPHDANAPRELMRLADTAMYEAKRGGKNRCVFANELPSPGRG
ncbi:putative diguanylate cyclase YegE [Fundidesulfovibrio magnetotacticus]|uniref:Putative diguanylate cyclase YegE n=1 Tax=Fundidesulfovibrio magnetotacticus TaxID=2730080 RepID=A0A6V8LUU1_9BACT|nr:sensor domain-containing diguanylate cyclase [Fundidesulfovibrio magnetotacticus]GFK93879.1 putative diguanylate cyclase YegE [Fundidesulfovibrio magnetotacticus]